MIDVLELFHLNFLSSIFKWLLGIKGPCSITILKGQNILLWCVGEISVLGGIDMIVKVKMVVDGFKCLIWCLLGVRHLQILEGVVDQCIIQSYFLCLLHRHITDEINFCALVVFYRNI